jgi:predicted ATPase
VHRELPTGTVTLLFTDVEGSTKLLHELGADSYAEALAAHRRVIREACARHDGVEVDTQGDAFFVAFATAPAALSAAAELTEALSSGPVRVRVGLHTGTPLLSDEGYVGVDVHRGARIAASGHGGQVLVSQETASLVDGDLHDLGEHRFKDLLAAERVYQLGSRDFPPLESLGRTNLPVAAWPLLGRERELAEICALVAGGVRLLTLTGPGGSGKTRLALQAAAELSDEFLDGTFFVALAPLRDTNAVRPAVAEAIGLQADDDVAGWLASRRVLLALDNLEHLEGVAAVVSELLVGEVVVLATSRAPLHLSAERELPVEPLPDEAAAELFVSRAAAAGRHIDVDETVTAVCRRLDNLPLAIELAAARAKLLAPAALLQRLDQALPLLASGAVDLPERQRTLRATIEWSYDLLDSDAQAAFRRLSVFRGSFTLDAAEAITGAELDQLAALLDHSLLKTLGDERFFLLETLREYARDRLDEAGETAEYALRHARWYLDRLQANYSDRLGSRSPEILAWYEAEQDNLRAMLDSLGDAAPIEAARAGYLLHFFWKAQGAYTEEHERLRGLLARDGLPHQSRAALLVRLEEVEMRLGRRDAAEAANREAHALAEPGTEPHFLAVVGLAVQAVHRGDTEEAVRLGRQALEEAERLEDASRIQAIGNLASILTSVGWAEEAQSVLERFVHEARRSGLAVLESLGLADLGELTLVEHDYESSRAAYTTALTQLRGLGQKGAVMESLYGLGLASLGLGQRGEARAAFAELLELALAHSAYVAEALSGIALAADPAAAGRAARLRGAVAQLKSDADVVMNAYFEAGDELERRFERQLVVLLGEEAWERETTAGSTMTLDQATALAQSLAGHRAQAVAAES